MPSNATPPGSTPLPRKRGWRLSALLLVVVGLAACSLPNRRARPLPEGSSVAATLLDSETTAVGGGADINDRELARALATVFELAGSADAALVWHGRRGIEPLEFDIVVPTSRIPRWRWRRDWVASEGVGSPLVLLRAPDDDRFVGKLGEALPVTALIDSSSTPVKLHLYDQLDHANRDTTIGGLPLARDYTAALAYLLGQEDLMPEMRALFNAGRYLDDLGLFRLDPFDPDKIPVVLVHGIKSNPQVWANMVNELIADPEIRDHYQLWLFSYPTGVPILYSAMRLRSELQAMREFYDPADTNPNLDRIVLVGHSMGGILSRLMISHSSEQLEQWTPETLAAMQLPPQTETLTRDLLHFKPQPYVGRAVFIAAPHRGSEFAQRRIIAGLSDWIRVPRELKSAALATVQLNPDLALIPGDPLEQFNSIDDLRPDSPFMQAMSEQPIAGNVPYHSIIALGKRHAGKPIETGNDSMVRYPSAHLEGAASEITIAAEHKIFDHPKTISEVRRILTLHLGAHH